MTKIVNGASAYADALKQLKGGAGMEARDQQQAQGPSFGEVLKDSLQSAADAQYKSEKVSAAGVAGKADMTDVLQAVNNAQMSLNTVLAVRDKVVAAYQEIMRTPM